VLQDLLGGTGVLELMHHHHVPVRRRTLASRTCRARSIGRRRGDGAGGVLSRRRRWRRRRRRRRTTTRRARRASYSRRISIEGVDEGGYAAWTRCTSSPQSALLTTAVTWSSAMRRPYDRTLTVSALSRRRGCSRPVSIFKTDGEEPARDKRPRVLCDPPVAPSPGAVAVCELERES